MKTFLFKLLEAEWFDEPIGLLMNKEQVTTFVCLYTCVIVVYFYYFTIVCQCLANNM